MPAMTGVDRVRRWAALASALAALCCAACSHPASVGADQRVDALLAQMSLAEKIALIHGTSEAAATSEGQAGYLPGLARLHIPPLRMADGPPGVLTRYPSTGLSATMALAATFSSADAERNGVVIGRDAQALGIDVVLEPYINMHRDQRFVRAYNTYGEDPLLTARIGAALITGIQSTGVMAQAKHYIAYDGANDVSLDAQTLHEIYLPPFEAAVEAGVSSIMCSYNEVNGAYACGNADTLTHILRDELHFKGFVTSDWGATHGTDFVNAGLDLEMPGSGTVMPSFFEATVPPPNAPRVNLAPPRFDLLPEEVPPPNASRAPAPLGAPVPPGLPAAPPATPLGMLAAVQRGLVNEQAVTRAAARVLGQMQRFDLLDHPPTHAVSAESVDTDEAVVRQTAEDAAVLLKNDAQALPLARADLDSLALIGPGAAQTIAVGKSGEKALGHVERQVGTLAVLEQLEPSARIAYAVADDMEGTPIPAANFVQAGGAGLRRSGQGVDRNDATLDFTLAGGQPLPAGTVASWSGQLRVGRAGSYELNLQVLGASASLAVDGRTVSASSPLDLHGNVLQPGQDNVLPTRDGLDNVRTVVTLTAGAHRLEVQVHGDASGQPVQVRLNWVTPEQRRADYAAAVAAARRAHKVVLFAWSRGTPDFQLPGEQDRLIRDVAAANPNTVVVLNVSEPVALPWLDKVRAVLLLWYPGDEGGVAGAELLLGRANPAGRLPFTWPRALEQSPADDPAHPERSAAGVNGKTTYSEGLFTGYRWFDQQQLTPLFPFGYGLSYSHFEYSGLSVLRAAGGGLDVSFKLRNSGAVDGDEVPQVYLGAPTPAPTGAQFAPRALAAFERVRVPAGAERTLMLHVAARALQYWSSGGWTTAAGARAVYVAASSRDVRLQGSIGP